MILDGLRVIHSLKGSFAAPVKFSENLFHLDTCQRHVWVGTESELFELEMPKSYETFSGPDAYLFLLEVATGLRSQILGETDIFGQLKETWKKFKIGHPFSSLDFWFQKLFEDTKEIRSQYLQNIGGASYGSLVRRLLKTHMDKNPGPILLVGAGQLARSVAPFLRDQELWILNRGKEKLESFLDELETQPGAQVKTISESKEKLAWQNAHHAVVCIPVDREKDNDRIEAWTLGLQQNPERALIHLGGLNEDFKDWRKVFPFYSLDDLFEVEKSQGKIRQNQIERARTACSERAQLRGLAASISLPHGWEDLAVFA
jgi:glutamyl-tRNA reductase